MKEVLFSEQQRFRQWWLWLLLLGVNILFLSDVYKQVYLEQQFGNGSMGNAGLVIAALVIFVITGLFMSMRLETRITEEGIYVRFFPFHISFKYYSWTRLSRLFVRQYNPLTEYGGWGLRRGFFGKGKAYNVSGNQGLQLEFTDQKRLLIGTEKPGELNVVLSKLGRVKT